MTYPTDFSVALRSELWHRALLASHENSAPGDIERWMIAWIRAHWPRGEWASLPPPRVAGEALHAWQHSVDNPGRFSQGKLL